MLAHVKLKTIETN